MSEVSGQVIYLVLLLVAVGGWVMVEYRSRLGLALRSGMAWGLIFIGVIAGFGIWGDIRKDILPPQVSSGNSVAIPRAQDGHYYPQVLVNGQALTLMADTGASGIVLSQKDAKRLGINLDNLAYVGTAQTANGTVQTARVRLNSLTLGPFTDQDVAAYVNDGEMDGSLLGMEYLGRFNIAITNQQMVLSR